MGERRLVVGYESALGFWRAVRAAAGERGVLEPAGKTYGARRLALSEQARVALSLCNADAPLDVVVPGANRRHCCELVTDHVWRGPVPDKRLVGVGDDVFVCTMPVIFAQLAATRDVIDLAELAYEMTGTYGVTPWEGEGFCGDVDALLDIAELRGYASSVRALRIRGSARAIDALGLVVPGSNSPRETDVAILFMMGRRRGGLYAPGFAMNAPVKLPESLAERIGQKTVIPDFSWPNGTIVEYDSNEEHQSPDARAHDEVKRRAYQAVGMDCLTLTNGILRSNRRLNLFAEELERSLGIRRDGVCERSLEARRDLRQRLFGAETEAAAIAELSGAQQTA